MIAVGQRAKAAVFGRVPRALAALALASLGLTPLCACESAKREEPKPASSPRLSSGLDREPLEALPETPPVDHATASLGRKLFHDKRLSSDGSTACASCHDLAKGGDDGLARSVGVGKRKGGINAPSVFNAALNFVQFWDGRAKTLEDQIDGPIAHPSEMNTTWNDVVAKLKRDTEYTKAFAERYPDGVTAANVRYSIAAFERTLLTHDAPFDRWLRGEQGALSPEQKEGYALFKGVGCIACHQGRNVGGNMFQRFGVLGDYFKDRGNVTEADYGRYNVTKDESDRFVFRVPSLRNVEHTAPYFHDGSAQTLPQAVQVMAKYQLGRKLSDTQIAEIVAFLKSLSGKVPELELRGIR
jgi:cytochrome c peroxidase